MLGTFFVNLFTCVVLKYYCLALIYLYFCFGLYFVILVFYLKFILNSFQGNISNINLIFHQLISIIFP